MLKKTLAIIITAVLICSFAGCGQSAANTADKTVTTADTGKAAVNTDTDIETYGNDSSEAEISTEESRQESSSENSSKADESSASQKNSDSTAKNSNTANSSNSANNSGTYNNNSRQAATEQNNTTIDSTGNTNTVKITETDATELFTDRDLAQTVDTSSATVIQAVSNKTETITSEGVYIIKGSASEFTVRVEADKQAKVQLVLDGLEVSNSNFPVIYVVSADKCFVTTTGTSNSLSVTGSFTSDGSTNTDAVIFSKDDLVLNGTGTLNINSAAGNGISGKDDLKITGGTYNITSAKDSIEANDSILIYDGSFNITSSKDGFHSENDDDDSLGWIYIRTGSFNISAASDSIQATTLAQIDGGRLSLTSSEGIEATKVLINNGTINITSSDDGINAAQKSGSYGTPTVEINGGDITIVMGQGDTDAVDANGDIIVNGGTINITAQMSSFDYDGTAQYNGGTIIINGTQVDSIPQSMMGGRGGMGSMGNMGGRGRMF